MSAVAFSNVDPITQVYRAIWDKLEAEKSFTDLVKRGNRLRFDRDDRDPEKDQRSSADFPEVGVFPTGGGQRHVMSTHNTRVTKTFDVAIRSGDKRVDEFLFPVEWAIIKAASAMVDTDLGLPSYVNDLDVTTNTNVDRAPDNQPIQGWFGVVTITVTMDFDTQTELLA